MRNPALLSACLVTLCATTFVDAAEWRRAVGHGPGVHVAFTQEWGTDADRSFTWSGLRVAPQNVKIELVATKTFLPSQLSNSFGLKQSASGEVSPFEYTLSEVWDAVKTDPTVIGVVPVGYLERGGVPEIAGLFQVGGEGQKAIMHAPPLTAVYCLDSPRNRSARSPDFQWAYNFAIEYNPSLAYSYSSDLSAVQFVGEGISADRLRSEFSACADKIQVGPRILEPRRRKGANDLKDRRSVDIFRDDVVNETRTRRTVLIYDLSGELTFLTTHGVATLSDLADLASDSGFYRKSPQQCAAAERKAGGGEGETDPATGRPTIRSQSCEYWAFVLTSFEHAGMILRRDEASPPQRIGRTNRMIGAALIIRRRSPEAVN